MKHQGRIKAISPTEIHKGMKVIVFQNGKWEILTISHPPTISPVCFIENQAELVGTDDIKILVLCYIESSMEKLGVEHVLLKPKLWNYAVENNLVNSKQHFEFEIKNEYFNDAPLSTGQPDFDWNNTPKEMAGFRDVAIIEITERVIDKKVQLDRLFIQEIINDLEENGYRPGDKNQSKAYQLLVDWSRELKEKAHSTGRTKKLHAQIVGAENY